MTAIIFNGRAVATLLQHAIADEIQQLQKHYTQQPTITTVMIGNDHASQLYLKLRDTACHNVGIHTHHLTFTDTTPEHQVLDAIHTLNDDPTVHGILIQYPLPPHYHTPAFMRAITPNKDVEGFHPDNLGRTFSGDEFLVPCTPLAVLTIITSENIPLKGTDAVIINHSNVVGKPLASLLLNRDATVSVCHVFTKDLRKYTTGADLLVTGAGVPQLITADHVKPQANVIDVGISQTDRGITGDVAFDAVKEKARFLTPVPGGVGPLTITMALTNMVKTYKLSMRDK